MTNSVAITTTNPGFSTLTDYCWPLFSLCIFIAADNFTYIIIIWMIKTGKKLQARVMKRKTTQHFLAVFSVDHKKFYVENSY